MVRAIIVTNVLVNYDHFKEFGEEDMKYIGKMSIVKSIRKSEKVV